jgi:phenylalanyl-tRNA synthetase alpha chain
MKLAELVRAAEEIWAQWEKATGRFEGSLEDLEALRVQILGRKGSLTQLFSALRELPPAERAEAGRILNTLKERSNSLLLRKRRFWPKKRGWKNLPRSATTFPFRGSGGPWEASSLTQVRREIEEIFMRLGFDVASGPEIETEYYNFEALNIGPDHPARDEWDSFYLGEGVLLRTHTSPVQIRVMKERKPPVRIICPGRCFRRDNPDATHSPVFTKWSSSG